LADGAFLVSAYKDSLNVIHGVEIMSRHGNKCRIQNPWPGKKVTITSGSKQITFSRDSRDVLSFNTSRGGDYLLLDASAAHPQRRQFVMRKNQGAKHLSEATLGKERTFNLTHE
jgi:alpha-L-fucosidase 2